MSAEYWANFVEYVVGDLGTLYTERDARAARSLANDDNPGGLEMFDRWRREVARLAIEEGLEWPDLGAKHTNNANYVIFPNFIFLVLQGASLAYRCRPDGLDPNSCIFDIYGLELYADGKAPEYEPQFFDDFRDADLGEILGQDMSNVADVTAGMASSRFTGAMINPVQEVGVFDRHLRSDEYLFGVDHTLGRSEEGAAEGAD
jgi:hypothetical protein